MERSITFILTAWSLQGSLIAASPCNTTNTNDKTLSGRECGDQPDPQYNNNPHTLYAPFHNTGYLSLIAAASVLLPIIVFVRICWLKRLQKQRNSMVNQARRDMLNNREGGPGIFTIDGIPYEEIYGKPPPTYEASMNDPDCDSPPPYDKILPCYTSVVPGDSICQVNEIPSTSNQELETSGNTP